MIKFYIDPKYAISVSEEIIVYKQESDSVTLFDIIKDPVLFKSVVAKDHPKFVMLRNKLSELGYILTEDRWNNGDRVIKPFILNGLKFKKGETFPCAAALNFTLRFNQH